MIQAYFAIIHTTKISKRPNLILPRINHLDGAADFVDVVVVSGEKSGRYPKGRTIKRRLPPLLNFLRD
jgi:hypothetical protein